MRCALGYLRGYQREAAGAVAALVLVAAANLATPQLIRVAIDVGFTQAQPSVLAETVAGLVALAFAQFRDSPGRALRRLTITARPAHWDESP